VRPIQISLERVYRDPRMLSIEARGRQNQWLLVNPFLRRRQLAAVDAYRQSAGKSENGAGSSRGDDVCLPPQAGNAASNSTQQVHQQESPIAVQSFNHSPQIPKRLHVEDDVHCTNVHEHGSDQSPRLPVEDVGSVARTPIE